MYLLITYLSILFVGGSIIAKIAEKLNIPDIPLLLIFGLILGPIAGVVQESYVQSVFGFIGNLGLIILLFIGSFEMEWAILRRVLDVVLKLDIFALLITLFISGIIFNLIFKLPLLSIIGFLFGSITCATDPATLIPIMSKLDINSEISVILEAESVFNDPLGIVTTVLCLSAMGLLATSENPLVDFFTLAIGGVVLGLIGGKFYEIIVSKIRFRDYIAPFTLGLTLVFWCIAEVIFPKLTGYEISGFMTVAIMGLYIGNTLAEKSEKREEMEKVATFYNELSVFVRILIFVLLGAGISLNLLTNYGVLAILCALGSIFTARPIGVLIATAIPPVRSITERIYMALEGPRGVVPATLAAMVYSEIMNNPSIVPASISHIIPPSELAGGILVATFMTIILSVVLEASWAEVLAKKLLKD
ncbi:cation:proton antiporter [Methanotorris formicicus]|uniref:Sodium/hydrogen exchanger n=1 Tax=Methanotorris formicicus Mc-S-70 TaxID=647171 RepID=H1L0I7_9EURY|nr:sodium:proton antiporter [Methanotorris formicicus]EHP84819.1 sodium/hydrogen exchanger [Methanotorris formicicus Mc-S-70]